MRALACGGLLALGACDVEWAGGQIALEDPAPPADTAVVEEAAAPRRIPLPREPHLLLVRLDPDGTGRATPLAALTQLEPPALAPVAMPAGEDPTYRGRFDSLFLAPGTELDLLARGARLGSVVLGEPVGTGGDACASVVRARALVLSGQDLPRWAFALRLGEARPFDPVRVGAPEATRSMSVAGPVLAERLIGGDRAFLAQRVSLSPVGLTGDTIPGMAATYLIADSLAPGPPGENAVSLFFLARFEPTQGYVPLWTEVRRYDAQSEKEVFEYLDWLRVGPYRLDALRRVDGASVRVAVGVSSVDAVEPELGWTEPAGCEALRRLVDGG